MFAVGNCNRILIPQNSAKFYMKKKKKKKKNVKTTQLRLKFGIQNTLEQLAMLKQFNCMRMCICKALIDIISDIQLSGKEWMKINE